MAANPLDRFLSGAAPDWGVPGSRVDNAKGGGPSVMGPATLHPHARGDGNTTDEQNFLRRIQVYPPYAVIDTRTGIYYQPRFRLSTFGGNGVGVGAVAPVLVPFSCPTIIVARTAAAFDASGAALLAGQESLDTFGIFMLRVAGNDSIDGGTTAIIANAILGNGRNPGFFQGNGVFFNTGGQMSVNCQLFRANMTIHVVLWCLEEYGPPRS